MRTLLLSVGLSLALTMGFTSCKKDDDDNPKSKTDILTQSGRKWKQTAQITETKVGASATVTNDDFADFDDCDKDDYTVFRTDKTLTVNPGALTCSSTDAPENGTWDFNSDQTKFQLASPQLGGLIVSFDIAQFDDSTIKLKYVDNSTPGTVETTTYTYSSF